MAALGLQAPYTTVEAVLLICLALVGLMFPLLVLFYQLGWVWRSPEDLVRRTGQILGLGLIGFLGLVASEYFNKGGSIPSFTAAAIPVAIASLLFCLLGFKRQFAAAIASAHDQVRLTMPAFLTLAVLVFLLTIVVFSQLVQAKG
ncbi:MAG: hypothetical protein V2J20_06045 [Wenzhouxiangella sp.]|jgi:hypothetical protein|nr:hypothetical protein [Wenzhouxiangella sp.]